MPLPYHVPEFPEDDKCERVSCYFLWLLVAFFAVAALLPVALAAKYVAGRMIRSCKVAARRRDSLRKTVANSGKLAQCSVLRDCFDTPRRTSPNNESLANHGRGADHRFGYSKKCAKKRYSKRVYCESAPKLMRC